jgi:hypothetical protein
LLSLLAEACDQAPVLCLIDDAHCIDRPTQEALTFAARRLEAEPVALLLAGRKRHRRHALPGGGKTPRGLKN